MTIALSNKIIKTKTKWANNPKRCFTKSVFSKKGDEKKVAGELIWYNLDLSWDNHMANIFLLTLFRWSLHYSCYLFFYVTMLLTNQIQYMWFVRLTLNNSYWRSQWRKNIWCCEIAFSLFFSQNMQNFKVFLRHARFMCAWKTVFQSSRKMES